MSTIKEMIEESGSTVKADVDSSIPDGEVGSTKDSPGAKHIFHDETGFVGSDFVPVAGSKTLSKTSQQYAKDALAAKGMDTVIRDPSGEDYVGPAETGKRRKIRKHLEAMMADDIYKEHKPAINRFRKAKTLVADATAEQLEDPDKILTNAIRIVDNGPPITKAAILEMAKTRAAHRIVNSKSHGHLLTS